MTASTRHTWLRAWAGLVSRRPGWILLLTAALAGASVWLTAARLRFEPDRNALIAPTLDFNQRFLDWIQTFAGTSDLYVVIDTHDAAGRPDDAIARQARALARALGDRLAEEPAVAAVSAGFESSQAHPRTLRLASPDEFETQMEQIDQSRLLLQSASMDVFFQALTRRMYEDMAGETSGESPGESIPRQQMAFFMGLIDALEQRLTTEADRSTDLLAAIRSREEDPWQYLATSNGRLLIVRVTPARDADALAPFDRAIRDVRRVMDQMRPRFPDVNFGLTGIDVIESDETAAVQRDTTWTSIGAAITIAALLVAAFHSVRLPLAMMAALGAAIAWTFAFTTLAIGHLQVISAVFAAILLGLGVAFAIHLASRFEHVRHDFPDDARGLRDALADTFAVMGPGLVTGAVTTAAAFATTLLTDFRGVAEMGVIAGVGVLLCLLAMFSLFAALLCLTRSRHRHVVPMRDRYVHFYEDRWIGPFVRHPWITLAGAAVVLAGSLASIGRTRFDYNLLAMLPPNVPSVTWQERIIRDGEQSIYTGVSITDSLNDAARMTQRLRRLDTVESVGGVGVLFPPDADERARRVRHLGDLVQRALPVKPTQPPNPLLSQLAGMQFGLAGTIDNAAEPLKSQLIQIQSALDDVLNIGRLLTPAQLQSRLGALQTDFVRLQDDLRGVLAQVLDDAPITVEDLAPAAMAPYVADTPRGRRFALEIHPKLPDGVRDPLDPRFLGRFVRDLESIDPNVTGVIVQVYHSGDLILRSYVKAGAIAMILVFVIVWIDFHSVIDSLAALVPVTLGFAATFAGMRLAGQSVNAANIIVLPLMFGIGVDFGVHMIHRYRMDRDTRPLGLSGGTGKGIALTAYTTMIGFGSMIFASHRGIAGLGLVLTVGIGLTLLACWTVMPAWLELRRRRAADPPPPQPPAW